jgi:cytochrome subunit of sulfide dehydrogenase
MKRTTLLVAALAFSGAISAQEATRSMASACAICHGTDGRSATKDIVPLAGLPAAHIASQMRAFRDGQRPATVMHQIAKGYTDQQIDAMASWFAAQKR